MTMRREVIQRGALQLSQLLLERRDPRRRGLGAPQDLDAFHEPH
jgi:hypothetical protein